MKQLISAILAVTLCSAAAISALTLISKAKESSGVVVVLGDSMATGFGLPGYNAGGKPKAQDSFGTLFAETSGYTQINLATDGHTTDDLLNVVKQAKNTTILAQADVVLISIGGNDFLHAFASGLNVTKPDVMVESIKLAIAEKLPEIFTNAEDNLSAAFKYIKKVAPNAKIVAQTLINPYMFWNVEIDGVGNVKDVFGSAIDQYNEILEQCASDNGITVADVAEHFKTNAQPNWVNASCDSYVDFESGNYAYDPHPTVKGHYEIYCVYAKTLGYEPMEERTEEETTEEPTTVEETTAEETTAEEITTLEETTEDCLTEYATTEAEKLAEVTTADSTTEAAGATSDEATTDVEKTSKGCKGIIPFVIPAVLAAGAVMFYKKKH